MMPENFLAQIIILGVTLLLLAYIIRSIYISAREWSLYQSLKKCGDLIEAEILNFEYFADTKTPVAGQNSVVTLKPPLRAWAVYRVASGRDTAGVALGTSALQPQSNNGLSTRQRWQACAVTSGACAG